MQASPGDGFVMDLLKGAGAFLMGALGAIAVFGARLKINETKLADHRAAIDEKLKTHKEAIDRDLAAHEQALTSNHNSITTQVLRTEREFRESVEALRKENTARHEENRATLGLLRRQTLMALRMIADIARHTGADRRTEDEIWRMLSEDPDNGRAN